MITKSEVNIERLASLIEPFWRMFAKLPRYESNLESPLYELLFLSISTIAISFRNSIVVSRRNSKVLRFNHTAYNNDLSLVLAGFKHVINNVVQVY